MANPKKPESKIIEDNYSSWVVVGGVLESLPFMYEEQRKMP